MRKTQKGNKMNKVVLMGRMTADADIKEFGKGKNAGIVASFRLAIRDGVDAEGNARTQFIQCTAWNGIAELVEKYAGKGKQICIAGKLVNNNYEKQDGTKVYQTEVQVSEVSLISEGEKQEKPKGNKYCREDLYDFED